MSTHTVSIKLDANSLCKRICQLNPPCGLGEMGLTFDFDLTEAMVVAALKKYHPEHTGPGYWRPEVIALMRSAIMEALKS